MEAKSDIIEYKKHIRTLPDADLLGILGHIDKKKVPDRYEAVVAECKRRNLIGKDIDDAGIEQWRLDKPVPKNLMTRYARGAIILVVVLLFGGPVRMGWQRFVDHRDRKALRTKVFEPLKQLPSYQRESDFIEQAFDESFAAEFAKLSKVTRDPTRKEAFAFLANIYDGMICAANDSGKGDLAKEIQVFKVLFATDPDEDEEPSEENWGG